MNEEDYKMAIKLLRLIASDVISLKEAYGIDDVQSILAKEELIEEIITANYIEEE